MLIARENRGESIVSNNAFAVVILVGQPQRSLQGDARFVPNHADRQQRVADSILAYAPPLSGQDRQQIPLFHVVEHA